jgi:hypothetical protein
LEDGIMSNLAPRQDVEVYQSLEFGDAYQVAKRADGATFYRLAGINTELKSEWVAFDAYAPRFLDEKEFKHFATVRIAIRLPRRKHQEELEPTPIEVYIKRSAV